MKTDAQLKIDVTRELDYEASITATHVGVAVDAGVVTLSGHLDTYAEKYAVERAVNRVEGVHAVAVDIDDTLAPSHQRSDSEIAEAAGQAIQWHALLPTDRIRVKVEHGWVTAIGQVDWKFQRKNADQALHALTGVRGISNPISVTPAAVPADVTHRIKSALERHASQEAQGIEVSVTGHTVTLSGHVDSWSGRESAAQAAWAAPGVTLVVNNLSVTRAD